ncbi:MAG: ShlB/FhaC/HecB family hemolysin secretion/activation protein [Pleurocapsa sp.]
MKANFNSNKYHRSLIFLCSLGLTNAVNYVVQESAIASELLIEPTSNNIAQVNEEPTPPPQPLPEENFQPIQPSLGLEELNPDEQVEIKVQKITVTGSTIFGDAEIRNILQPLAGKTVSLTKLKEKVDDLTQLYLAKGYITSRAILIQDTVGTDNIKIRIIEGQLEKIEIEGTNRLKNYIRSRINLAADTPLNTAKLEDQLRLLRIDPLFENIEASLKAGSSLGKSIVVVRAVESDRFYATFGIDNYSPPSVGSERLGIDLAYRNLIKGGDRISASYYPRLEAFTKTFDLGFQYQIPVNAKNGTITAGADINRNEIVNPIGDSLDDLDIEGETEKYTISFRQPIIRDPRQELALSLGFDYQDGQTFLLQGGVPFGDSRGFPFGKGPDDEGVSKTSVFRFGQEYIKRQVSGAWAFRSQLNLGVGIFGATDNEGDIPDGQFFSWLGQVQRVQVFNSSHYLIVQGDLQLTPDSLLPSQQFVIGGGQSVRGYRQNVRSGDNGFLLSVEDRLTLFKNRSGESILTFAPFFNMGTVWNQGDNPNELPDQNFIAALGIGLIAEPIKGLNLKLDYAPPLVDLDDRGDNIQDDGLHFSVSYSFSY